MNLKRKCLGFFLIFALLPACGAAFAEETDDEAAAEAQTGIATSLDLAYVTKYVWRGMVVNDDPAIQPSLTFSHPNGLNLNFWGSLDTTDFAGQKGNITEIDYTLDYAWCTETADWDMGVSYFTYPRGGSEETGEIYTSACFGGDLSLTLTANYDFKLVKGFYFSLEASRDCQLPYSMKENPMTLGLSAKIGYGAARYNEGYFGVDKSVLSDLLVSASLPLPVNDKLTLTPFISYSTLLNTNLKEAVRAEGSDPANTFGGLTCSFSF